MSKTWYPIIDYDKCRECGICIDKCSHEVYDKGKAPKAVVVSPQTCVEGCAGCADICPYGAITYFGDRELSLSVYGGECGGCVRKENSGCGGCTGCGHDGEK
jgi:NAD-dependent dihydropyrimidine dehydrogenase PreA subunit